MKKIFILFFLFSIQALALTQEVLVNGKTVDATTYKLQIGEFVILNCNADPSTMVEASIDYGSTGINSGAKQGSVTATKTIDFKDGKLKGLLKFRCTTWAGNNQKKENITDLLEVFISTETKELNDPELQVQNMSLLVNDKPVDLDNYKLKVGDIIKLTCSANQTYKDQPIYVTASIGHVSVASGSGFQQGASIATRKISSQDGKSQGDITFKCSTWNGNDVYKSDIYHTKEISLKTVTKRVESRLNKAEINVGLKKVALKKPVENVAPKKPQSSKTNY